MNIELVKFVEHKAGQSQTSTMNISSLTPVQFNIVQRAFVKYLIANGRFAERTALSKVPAFIVGVALDGDVPTVSYKNR